MINFVPTILIVSKVIPEYTDEDLIFYVEPIKCIPGSHHPKINICTHQGFNSYKDFLSYINEHKTIDYIVTNKYTDEITINILQNASVEFTKKWCPYDENPDINIIKDGLQNTLILNIDRKISSDVILFSFYTSTYNTSENDLNKLYNSLCVQQYPHWNWYIIDDSTNDSVESLIKSYNDPRIHLVRNFTDHANIGMNKHNVAMMCNGDWLLEIDHDDEIVPCCLNVLYETIKKYPNSKFVYSDAIEERISNNYHSYGDEYTFCAFLGIYRNEEVNEKMYEIGYVNGLNPVSIRTINAAPNHIRCIKKDFYHKINGHEQGLEIIDDLDVMIRIFLNIDSIDEITYIKKILYIQHNENTTSDNNVGLINLYNFIMYVRYDQEIHQKLISLGFNDDIYDETLGYSYVTEEIVDKVRDKLPLLCNIYEP